MREMLLLTVFALIGAHANGQVSVAARLREQRAREKTGTLAWFESGFEIVEAELAYDIASAVTSAASLVSAAESANAPDLLAVASAMHQFSLDLRDGPARTGTPAKAGREDFTHESSQSASAMSDALSSRFHAARARSAWLADEPNEFLPNVFTSLVTARRSGDPILRLRASWALHRAIEFEAEAYDAELLREIDSVSNAPGAERFAPWRRLNAYWRSSAQHTRQERLAELARILSAADAIGDLRTRVHAEWDRAGIDSTVDVASAQQAFEGARAGCERLGDRRMLAVALEQLAEFALQNEQFEAASDWLRRAGEVTAGRGLPDRESTQAHLRLRLALRRDDTLAAAAETASLEGLRRNEGQRYRGYSTLREQLLSAERQRLEAEAVLAHERKRAAERLATARKIAGIGAIVALASIAAIALVGQRRLKRQVVRAETETATRRGLEQRMQRLERADSLGVFASGIAHDFNNLMVGVIGNAELLQRDERDPQRQRLLGALLSAGERGARLCRQLQAHANEQPTPPTEFDLAELVRTVLPVLEASTREQCSITLQVDSGPIAMTGSATEIEQVILNLVSNARDAGARKIGIRVAQVAMADADWPTMHVFGEPRPGEFSRVDVEDDGEGMRAEQIDRIFDPFFTTRFPGRGLGLAGVHAVMRHHRGAIVVESEPGRGSKFRVYLPCLANANLAPAVIPTGLPGTMTHPGPVPAMTVLVIDDEPHIREYIQNALQRRGHSVISADDATDLSPIASRFRDGQNCAALVDLTMPNSDGRDVVHQLQRLSPNLTIVLMSGHDADHLEATERQLGAHGWIAKPFTGDILERTLAAALRRRQGALNAGAFKGSASAGQLS